MYISIRGKRERERERERAEDQREILFGIGKINGEEGGSKGVKKKIKFSM